LEYRDWDPIYYQILEEFRFSRQDDELSARILASMVEGKKVCGPECLDRMMHTTVTVYGYGPNLEKEMEAVKPLGTIISADGATSELMKRGIVPDIIVTDLDGEVCTQVRANSWGAVAVIHAHGDNVMRLKEYVPFFQGWITPTTQSRPFNRVYNFGGFTDGDRAVMLARHFGASRILLVGFDFDEVRSQRGKDSRTKARKLDWARRMIFDLNPPGVSLLTP